MESIRPIVAYDTQRVFEVRTSLFIISRFGKCSARCGGSVSGVYPYSVLGSLRPCSEKKTELTAVLFRHIPYAQSRIISAMTFKSVQVQLVTLRD